MSSWFLKQEGKACRGDSCLARLDEDGEPWFPAIVLMLPTQLPFIYENTRIPSFKVVIQEGYFRGVQHFKMAEKPGRFQALGRFVVDSCNLEAGASSACSVLSFLEPWRDRLPASSAIRAGRTKKGHLTCGRLENRQPIRETREQPQAPSP